MSYPPKLKESNNCQNTSKNFHKPLSFWILQETLEQQVICCTVTQGFGKQKKNNLDREQSTALFAQVSQLRSKYNLVQYFYFVSTDNSFPIGY
jgi:hypothetical protein